MRFELVRERLRALPRELPAPPAILMPVRIDAPEDWRHHGATVRGRQAAVLVLLFPDETGEACVLITARVPHLAKHAGEVSFPGGAAEEGDADPIATAFREAAEEVGLDAVRCGAVATGSLERPFIPVSGFRITPVVALAERRPDTVAAPDEVARIIEAPVEAFLPDAPMELEERVIRERLVRFGVYPVSGERVWGATARMLGQLGALLASETAPEPVPPRRTGPLPDTVIRPPEEADATRIDEFLIALAPELARARPDASGSFVAYAAGRLVGLASWAPWDRDRTFDDVRGFDGVTFSSGERPAELTLLAVAPDVRGAGIGRRLTDAIADAASHAGARRLLAWTLSDAAIHPSSVAARTFFRSNGFRDLAVDRQVLARGEDRLLLARDLRG